MISRLVLSSIDILHPQISVQGLGEAHTAVVADLNRGSQCEVCLPGEENRVK